MKPSTPYIFKEADQQLAAAPILISVPHCGVFIPADLQERMNPSVISQLTDTDWHVHTLYNFANKQGMNLLHAHYSRYVIDLNRPHDGQKLYQDGRQETGLVPLHTFAGESIYLNESLQPTTQEIQMRVQAYYQPYHQKIQELLTSLRKTFKHVLLFEAHSIRRHVPLLAADPLPDLMLGNQQGRTCPQAILESAFDVLSSGGYDVAKNQPFMGGYITRTYANLAENVYTLQLEMSQDIYMDERTSTLDTTKAMQLTSTLQKLMTTLQEQLFKLNAES